MTSRDALKDQVLKAPWADLADHHARGGLLIVAPDEDLLDVGLSIARDDAARVEALLRTGGLAKSSQAHAETFAGRESLRFQVLIVQPYVLAQALPELAQGSDA